MSKSDMMSDIRLSFSLTRIQRVLNPPDRLVIVITAVGTLTSLTFLLLVNTPERNERNEFVAWAAALAGVGIGTLGFGLFCRRLAASLFYDLFGGRYLNTFILEGDTVFVGIDQPELAINRKLLRVRQGLWGTIVVWHPHGYSVILPRSAVSLEKLRKALGCN